MSKATSTAVMQRRLAGLDGIDDFPTQPWGTRAFVEHGPAPFEGLEGLTVWEPCAGRRTMSRILAEYRPGRLIETDIADYGAGLDVMDFRHAEIAGGVDWVITNPPFSLSLDLWRQAMSVARVGVAFLLRVAWLEGVERYHALYGPGQVRFVAPYSERLPMVCGHLDRNATSATCYCWFVALKADPRPRPEVHVIPPVRRVLEREDDYDGWPNQYRLITKDKDGKRLPKPLIEALTDAQGNPIATGADTPQPRQTNWLDGFTPTDATQATGSEAHR